jgi:hypothetical protein
MLLRDVKMIHYLSGVLERLLKYVNSFAVHYAMHVALVHEKIVIILFPHYEKQLPTISKADSVDYIWRIAQAGMIRQGPISPKARRVAKQIDE